jgi:hypothetical protein
MSGWRKGLAVIGLCATLSGSVLGAASVWVQAVEIGSMRFPGDALEEGGFLLIAAGSALLLVVLLFPPRSQ